MEKSFKNDPISGPIRAALLSSEASLYAVAKATGLPYASVHAFARGGEAKASTLDRLAAQLGLVAKPRD